jgi:HSP20 family protein
MELKVPFQARRIIMTYYLDKLIDNAFRSAMYGNTYLTSTGYSENISNGKDSSTISLAVPGIAKEDIELEVKEEGLLTIKFLKQNEFFKTQNKSWTLSEDIDVENVTAECKNGMLTVLLPKLKRLPSSRKVEIL